MAVCLYNLFKDNNNIDERYREINNSKPLTLSEGLSIIFEKYLDTELKKKEENQMRISLVLSQEIQHYMQYT